MIVLIPSDNRDFVAELATGYVNAGCEVVTGAYNFDLAAARFDLVHFQWPEELTGWRLPSEQRLRQIADRISWWEDRCPTIVTAHNFYPHGHEGNPTYKKLYELFYQKCSAILHFSSISKEYVCKEFGAAHTNHLVTNLFTFESTLRAQRERGECRREFGFGGDDFIILIMGALRSAEECNLVTKAYTFCHVPNKRLLMAGRTISSGSLLERKWRQLHWRFWLWRNRAKVEENFIPDEELYRYLDTADVVLVPRIRDFSSGIPGLAMTFGKMVIAPNHGAFPEYLAGTGNLLYESGNTISLARAMEKAATLDRAKIGDENRQRADGWRWDTIVDRCLQAISRKPADIIN